MMLTGSSFDPFEKVTLMGNRISPAPAEAVAILADKEKVVGTEVTFLQKIPSLCNSLRRRSRAS
jgi:hypothetical protein